MAVELAPGVTLSDATLAQIVVQAAETMGDARVRRPRRGLDVRVADGRARVELELAVHHGAVLCRWRRSCRFPR